MTAMKGKKNELRRIVYQLDRAHVALFNLIDRSRSNDKKLGLEVARRDLIQAIKQIETTGNLV